MTRGYIGTILAGLASDKACDAFIRVGFVDADGVRVPVGGAESWGARLCADVVSHSPCAIAVAVKVPGRAAKALDAVLHS